MDGSAYGNMLPGNLSGLFRWLCIVTILAPLGLWKLIEILIWAFRHIRIWFE